MAFISIRSLSLFALTSMVSATVATGETPVPADAQSGTIIIYRGSSVWGAAVGCPVRHEGRELIDLSRGKFAEWKLPAGRYVLTNKTSSIEIAVDPGEVRYVRCVVKPGFLAGRADLQIADRASFEGIGFNQAEKLTVGIAIK